VGERALRALLHWPAAHPDRVVFADDAVIEKFVGDEVVGSSCPC
jgi:hypothetical protein